MANILNLHPDFLDFAEYIIAEHGSGTTLTELVELAGREAVEQFVAEAGLESSDPILAEIAALQGAVPGTLLLVDVLAAGTSTPRTLLAWKPVCSSLRCILVGMLVVAGAKVMLIFVVLPAAREGGSVASQDVSGLGVPIFWGLADLLAGVLGFVLILIGMTWCWHAGTDSAAKRLAGWSLVFSLLSPIVGVSLAIHMVDAAELKEFPNQLVLPALVAFSLACLGRWLFVIALARMASFFCNLSVPRMAKVYLACTVLWQSISVTYNLGDTLPMLSAKQRNIGFDMAPRAPIERHRREIIDRMIIFTAIGFVDSAAYIILVLKSCDVLSRALAPEKEIGQLPVRE